MPKLVERMSLSSLSEIQEASKQFWGRTTPLTVSSLLLEILVRADVLDDGNGNERDGLEDVCPLRQSLHTILVGGYGWYRDEWCVASTSVRRLEKTARGAGRVYK